ncbi:arsinothricin resistance N-acetyltransferase ArsN1 family B [Hyphomonas jannaschiana]|uniref:N-acetyltransferase GCN5 n=1 Tax=Hyphomonas jannaschiana VP2 TaxID=1280952 RepID=A0A059FKB6_9PROT|nr:arsinothricin resistance N-acetyltransferase ArsN1 family B [Hyphomonas jannaschiana]KCZ91069.1 N-acetyltransferase GCN5 [Hyphomonas jannaschiana VP2]
MSLTIRVASSDDAGWIADIYAPYVRNTVISFELIPPSVEEMAQRIETTLQIYPWLVAEEAGHTLGYAYASQHRTRAAYKWSCDVSVYVAPAAQGRKVGTRLYQQLLETLAGQGFRNAFAGIALPNDASIALHERLGFSHLGTYTDVGCKLGAWHDVGWWQKSLSDTPGVPDEPVPFQQFRTSC